MLTKQETSLGRGRGESSGVRSPGRTAPHAARGPGFMVRGFVSGCLWPIFLTQGPSWGRPHRSANMDSSKEDSGRTRGLARPLLFRPFPILPVGSDL